MILFQNMDLLRKVDDLLHFGEPENLAEAIELLLPYSDHDPDSNAYLAKAYVLAGKTTLAIAAADKLISAKSHLAVGTWYRWGYFWKAAAFAVEMKKPEMLDSLSKAYEVEKDMRKHAISTRQFEPFYDDPAFLSLLDLPSRPNLEKPFYDMVRYLSSGRSFQAYELAKSYLDEKGPSEKNGASDEVLSALDAIVRALEIITEDLDEHGDANLDYHGAGKVSVATFHSEYEAYKSKRMALGPKASPLANALIWKTEEI